MATIPATDSDRPVKPADQDCKCEFMCVLAEVLPIIVCEHMMLRLRLCAKDCRKSGCQTQSQMRLRGWIYCTDTVI